MQWYYLDANKKQVEVSEEQLGELFKNGTITADTLVWSEKLTDWTPLGTALPHLTGGASPLAAAQKNTPASSSAPAPTGTSTSSSGSINPYAAPNASLTGGGNATVQSLAGALTKNAGWIKFFAILMIIGGAINCITIIYAIIGWLPIWLGVILMKAVSLAQDAESSGSENTFREALEKLGQYFKISGIMTIIFFALGIIAFIIIMATGIASQGFEGSY